MKRDIMHTGVLADCLIHLLTALTCLAQTAYANGQVGYQFCGFAPQFPR